MNSVEVIVSRGKYAFEIGKNENGFYLQNSHTVIPNEFGQYTLSDLERMFSEICTSIEECIEKHPKLSVTVENEQNVKPEFTDGNGQNEFFLFYDDGTVRKFVIKDDVKLKMLIKVRAALHEASGYCEFFVNEPEKLSHVIDLEHMRKVCKSGIEQYDFFFDAVSGYINDYETLLVERKSKTAGIELYSNVCGRDYGPVIVLAEDGTIEYAGRDAESAYVRVLKEKNIKITGFAGYRFNKLW